MNRLPAGFHCITLSVVLSAGIVSLSSCTKAKSQPGLELFPQRANQPAAAPVDSFSNLRQSQSVGIVTDAKTGCQYLLVESYEGTHGIAVTPRFYQTSQGLRIEGCK